MRTTRLIMEGQCRGFKRTVGIDLEAWMKRRKEETGMPAARDDRKHDRREKHPCLSR